LDDDLCEDSSSLNWLFNHFKARGLISYTQQLIFLNWKKKI